MDDKKVGKFWNQNAQAWTELSRLGYDIYRNHVNTPAFFKVIPNINNLQGLDVGCGEGYNTRIAVENGAIMAAIDISEVFIKQAKQIENKKPLGMNYQVASATELPFENKKFDFVISTMALMDVADYKKALSEIYRVLKPRGFFQFSILHPCYSTPIRKSIKNENNEPIGIFCADYFNEIHGEIEEWIFSTTPEDLKSKYENFKIPRFHRTLSTWFNSLINLGFTIEYVYEPYPSDQAIKLEPHLKDCKVVAYFLIIRCRK